MILAGVSLNAIVGDNGIITNAMSAKQKQGMVALEEFLQQKYVENYEKFAEDELKINVLEKMYPSYFYIPSKYGVGSLKYVVDSDGKALYLIDKEGLPKEIKEGLVGGDAGNKTYLDYFNLNDVYGVTADLKVYYCSNGKESISGVLADELDDDNPQRVVFPDSNPLSSALSTYDLNGDNNISAEEIKSVKELVIDENLNMDSLADLFNLSSLQKLTIKTKNLDNLNGIENCPHLYYVYFYNSIIKNYDSLCGLNNLLQYLYFYSINDEELNKICNSMSKTDFLKLEYFYVVGNEGPILNGVTYNSYDGVFAGKSTKTITTLKPFNNLSDNTKKKIKYFCLNNNTIIDENLNYIKDFTNIYALRIEYNSFKSLVGLESFNNLNYIYGSYNLLGEGCDGDEEDNINNALVALKNHTKLYYLNLRFNSNLRWVNSLATCTGLRYIYLNGCNSNMTVNGIADRILACGLNYTLPCKFLVGKSYTIGDYYTAKDVTYEQLYSDLFSNLYIEYLNIGGVSKLTDLELNTILSSMTNVKYLVVNNCNLSSLNFIALDKICKLYELDTRWTNVKDFTNLKNNTVTLGTLRCGGNLDGSTPILSNIQDVINKLNGGHNGSWYNTGGLVFGKARRC